MSYSVTATAEQMNIAGFDATWVKDVVDGDVIMIWPPGSDTPVELTVSRLEGSPMQRSWIGVLPSGATFHCSYHGGAPCYKKRPEEVPIPVDLSEFPLQ